MRTFQKLVIYMLLGIGAGNLLNLIFSMAYGEFSPGKPIFIESFSSVNTAVLVETIVFAILGLLQGLASNIFQSKLNDNIKITFIAHYCLILLPLVLAGYYLKWFSSFTAFLSMILLASIIYLVIGVVKYFSIRKSIREINEKLLNYK